MEHDRDTVVIKLCESLQRRGGWKVWVITPTRAGYLRMGFAWKTRGGAERAAMQAYPGANWTTSSHRGGGPRKAGRTIWKCNQ